MIWPPSSEPLEGSIVRLEALRPEHRDGLDEAAGDAEIWTWMDRRIPVEEGAFERWFQTRLAVSEHGDEWCFATISVATGRPLGSSSYLHVRPEHDGLEIGWTWLNPAAWRTGANAEAKLLMLATAFDELGCMRVEFKTDARNQRSRASLEALPASFEGIFRKHMLMPVVGVRDSAYYAITDGDWPQVRERLSARIDRAREAATHA
ncbi:MAG: GNAT family N-acetyltransferase [Vicinamibacteria bacterium]